MRVFYGFDNLPHFRDPIVTMGSYDGVHAGHRVLLGRIVDLAHQTDGESVVITFSPHPRTVLDPTGALQVKLLNSLKEKILLLDQLGVNNLIVAPFTKEFSLVNSHDFVREYLIDQVGVSTLVVGYNHHFGHNKEGSFEYLYRLQAEFGFTIYEVPRQQVDNDKVSSTIVRELIGKGKMSQAAHALTQPYFMICQSDTDGEITTDEPRKLLPCDGTYHVKTVAAGIELDNELIISDGKPRLTQKNQIVPHTDFIVKFL